LSWSRPDDRLSADTNAAEREGLAGGRSIDSKRPNPAYAGVRTSTSPGAASLGNALLDLPIRRAKTSVAPAPMTSVSENASWRLGAPAGGPDVLARGKWARGLPLIARVIVPCLGLLAVDSTLTVAGLVLGARSYAIAALVIAAVVFLVQRRHGRTVASLSAVSIVLVTCVLYFWPLSGRKALVRSAQSIQPGMTKAEVGERMAEFIPGHPYAGSIPAFFLPPEPCDIWNHGSHSSLTGFDHFIVRYDAGLHVQSVELILD
jgi:hypothetical protein